MAGEALWRHRWAGGPPTWWTRWGCPWEVSPASPYPVGTPCARGNGCDAGLLHRWVDGFCYSSKSVEREVGCCGLGDLFLHPLLVHLALLGSGGLVWVGLDVAWLCVTAMLGAGGVSGNFASTENLLEVSVGLKGIHLMVWLTGMCSSHRTRTPQQHLEQLPSCCHHHGA